MVIASAQSEIGTEAALAAPVKRVSHAGPQMPVAKHVDWSYVQNVENGSSKCSRVVCGYSEGESTAKDGHARTDLIVFGSSERTRMIKLFLLLVGAAAVMLFVYVRVAPSEPARWHEDPRLVTRPNTPNFYLVRMVGGDAMPQVFQRSVQDLAKALDAIARADGAVLLAGSVESGHMTYLTRTRVVGFPDYTSILIEPAGEGAMLLAFARARFGHSDLGNNRARLERWIKAVSGQVNSTR